MGDVLIRERNGTDEVWFSESYLKREIESAYKAGIHKGIRVEFHAIELMNEETVESLVEKFQERVSEEFYKAYKNNEVWKISK